MEISVFARQWMWKLQHPDGKTEINELHVPVGRNVKLTMTSEDVIHDFFIPAFRTKADVLPGRYTTLWFRATRAGRYRLFCAEYCGTSHARMGGWVTVMEPADFENWLSGEGAEEAPETAGATLFETHACSGCHVLAGGGIGPSLAGLYGSVVELQDGTTLSADDNYIRESILNPRAKIVAGYQPVMPAFQNQFDEQQLSQLIAFIRSLR
jgi:cytochrome c oxidase subunit 2